MLHLHADFFYSCLPATTAGHPNSIVLGPGASADKDNAFFVKPVGQDNGDNSITTCYYTVRYNKCSNEFSYHQPTTPRQLMAVEGDLHENDTTNLLGAYEAKIKSLEEQVEDLKEHVKALDELVKSLVAQLNTVSP